MEYKNNNKRCEIWQAMQQKRKAQRQFLVWLTFVVAREFLQQTGQGLVARSLPTLQLLLVLLNAVLEPQAVWVWQAPAESSLFMSGSG